LESLGQGLGSLFPDTIVADIKLCQRAIVGREIS
jgi:hypothetical protein